MKKMRDWKKMIRILILVMAVSGLYKDLETFYHGGRTY
jgi:hypothetical protein